VDNKLLEEEEELGLKQYVSSLKGRHNFVHIYRVSMRTSSTSLKRG